MAWAENQCLLASRSASNAQQHQHPGEMPASNVQQLLRSQDGFPGYKNQQGISLVLK
jgi:hypothetical protein